MRRSNVTAERIDAKRLEEAWVYRPPHPPRPAWPGPARWDAYVKRMGLASMRNYDESYQVIVVGDSVYYGSSADDAVHCLEATSGREKWRFTVGGPVRIPPTWRDGKLYFGSDDGAAYCLDDGGKKLFWTSRPARPRYLLNDGRLVCRGRAARACSSRAASRISGLRCCRGRSRILRGRCHERRGPRQGDLRPRNRSGHAGRRPLGHRADDHRHAGTGRPAAIRSGQRPGFGELAQQPGRFVRTGERRRLLVFRSRPQGRFRERGGRRRQAARAAEIRRNGPDLARRAGLCPRTGRIDLPATYAGELALAEAGRFSRGPDRRGRHALRGRRWQGGRRAEQRRPRHLAARRQRPRQGLVVANGALYVCTDRGTIYCFRPGESKNADPAKEAWDGDFSKPRRIANRQYRRCRRHSAPALICNSSMQTRR